MGRPSPGQLPAVTVVEITDPTAASAGIELVDLDAVQLQPLPLRVRRVIVRLGASTVLFHSTNRRIRTRTSPREGLLAFASFGPRSSGTVNGLRVRPGLLLAAAADAQASFVAEAGYESVTAFLRPDEIRVQLAARGRESEFRIPQGIETLRPTRTVFASSSTGAGGWSTLPRANRTCSTPTKRSASRRTPSWSSTCWPPCEAAPTSSPIAASAPGSSTA
jgi:hypothetical protein